MMSHPRSFSRILVTGGAGFIGSNFIHHLLSSKDPPERVVNLDCLSYAGSLNNLAGLPQPHRHRFVQGDINDTALVASLLREERIQAVVHFAAESHVDRSIAGPMIFVTTNVLGTVNLLECVRRYWIQEQAEGEDGGSLFLHVSTDEVYGQLGPEDPPFTERSPYAPNSPYAASKAASDHFVRSYGHTYGVPVVITHCTNNYGPRQHKEKLIPTVIHACMEQRPIPVYGKGDNVRDWLHVRDHCQGIWMAMQHGRLGESYDIGGDNGWSNLDLVRLICRHMDGLIPARAPHDRLITFVEDRAGHDWRYAIQADKMLNEIGWAPQISFTNGLAQTIDWFVEQFYR